MPKRFRVLLLLVSVLIAGLIAGLVWQRTRAPENPIQAGRAPGPSIGDAPEDNALKSTRPPPAAAELPSLEVLTPDGIAALLRQAEAGEARAACELGSWLIACGYSAWYTDANLESARRKEKQADARSDHAAANAAASFLLRGASLRKRCADFPPELKGRAFDFMRTAALGGEPEAIVRYATGQVLAEEPMAPHRFLREPRFETWRSEAPTMIEALERSGDPQAVLALVDAINERNHLALLLPPDPVKDAAYLALARRLFAEHPALQDPTNRPALTSAQRREAEALAASWHHERFANRTFRLDEHTTALAPIFDLGIEGQWPQPSVNSRPCFASDPGGSN